MDVAIVGAGYVGLVTAACLAHLGHAILCLDVDTARVDDLGRGQLPVREPGLDELVAEGLASGRLRFSADRTALHGSDLVIVCVGTLDADEEWTDSIVRSAVRDIASDPGEPAARLAEDLRSMYSALDAPVVVTDLTSAETIKLASNVFLAAKITFANELARLCAVTGADVAAVVDGM